MTLDLISHHTGHKIQLKKKWIKDLNKRPEAEKLLEEIIRDKIPGLGNDFW
jgi:hypothetical protein